MRLTFKYTIKPKKKEKEIIDEIIWHSTRVYNMLNYELKEGTETFKVKGSLNVESSRIYKRYRKDNWHSEYLHSHTLQEVILNVMSNYKSYIELEEKYKNKSKEIKGKPRQARYKKENKMEITFSKYAIREEGKKIKLSISKKMKEKFKVESLNFLIPRKLKKLVNFRKIKMIKIRKENEEKYSMNIIYEKEAKQRKGYNIMSIDLGLNNMATCTNANNKETLIVAGENIKSKIRYYNKEIRRLQQIQMKMIKRDKYKNTKRIKRLYEKRNNYVKGYMHKASRMVVDYAIENKCNTIVIGDIKNIKQNMKKNKSFVQVPLESLVQKIKYKAELEGIEVVKVKENYTSGVSSIDKEEIIRENYNKKRRITRGIFISKKGIKINADINGSLNIMRKYIKSFSPNLEIAMDIGREQRPLKKRVA